MEPVAERIMSTVRSRLAVFSNAYRSTTVATWKPRDLAIHVQQGNITHNEELSCPGNPPAQAWDLKALVFGIVKPSSTDTTPTDTFKNRFWAEIVKAACNAPLWHQWGGLAVNTQIGQVEDYASEDGSMSGVRVVMTITFRTDEDNPFNVRA